MRIHRLHLQRGDHVQPLSYPAPFEIEGREIVVHFDVFDSAPPITRSAFAVIVSLLGSRTNFRIPKSAG
jgi:hypothetical protein